MHDKRGDSIRKHINSLTTSMVEDELGDFLKRVKCLIKDSVQSLISFLPSIHQELLENHFTGGKFVRTQAMFLLARCVERNDINYLVQTASALELVHRSTLLIDDMVDCSSSRNETQSIYIDFGPNKTAFLSHIFTAMGVRLCPDPLKQDLLHASEQLNIGQLAEHIHSYNFTSAITVLDDFIHVASLKSGSLGMFALLAALNYQYCRDANDLGVDLIAHNLAIAYQIANDLDDLTPWIQSNVEDMPNDVTNCSPSLPLLLARQLAVTNQIHIRAFNISWSGQEAYLRDLLRESGIIQTCYQYIAKYLEDAVTSIRSSWPANSYSNLFQKLCSSKWLSSYMGTASEGFKETMMNSKKECDKYEQQ